MKFIHIIGIVVFLILTTNCETSIKEELSEEERVKKELELHEKKLKEVMEEE